MEIHGPGGVSGPGRLEPQNVPLKGNESTGETPGVTDRVEISEHAKLLEKLADVPAVRTERVEELKRLIETGEYESAERIEKAVEKLLEEL